MQYNEQLQSELHKFNLNSDIVSVYHRLDSFSSGGWGLGASLMSFGVTGWWLLSYPVKMKSFGSQNEIARI